jgi:Anti-sigma factor NepR
MTPAEKDHSPMSSPQPDPVRGGGEESPDLATSDSSQSELDSAAQALIGHHLRTLYGEIVREPIPEQFLKLLQDLERRELE